MEWDRQKNESSKWFLRFDAYRLMGPDRKFLGAFKAAQTGPKIQPNLPSSWKTAFEKFNWKHRAEAWDMHERKKIRQDDEKMRQRVRNARKTMIEKGIMKLHESLDIIDPGSAKFGEIMTGIKTLSEQARLEFGDNAISTPVSHDILEALLAGEMSVREAALRYNQEGLAMPKAVEIMLSKEPTEEAAVDESVGIITEEELDRIYAERTGASNAQKENFVPQRNAEVKELKEELADSFADQALAEDDAVEMI